MPTRAEPQRCECCGRVPECGVGKTLHLDHCHMTGKFRGWLCHYCNTAIGALGDNTYGVLQAYAYLMEFG